QVPGTGFIQTDTVVNWRDISTGIEGENTAMHGYELLQNYPNPANPSTAISFTVPCRCRVTISLYNVLGREIRRLADGAFGPGKHTVLWDGLDDSGQAVSGGIYFYRMRSGDFATVRKALMLK
ncbi:MAG: FlgD immunoglobulin-like domain containing protein, partial [Calditrichia bacterium]